MIQVRMFSLPAGALMLLLFIALQAVVISPCPNNECLPSIPAMQETIVVMPVRPSAVATSKPLRVEQAPPYQDRTVSWKPNADDLQVIAYALELRSCRRFILSDGRLSARCRNGPNGDFDDTELVLGHGCEPVLGVRNVHGALHCFAQRQSALNRQVVPPGPYLELCANPYVESTGLLRAVCQTTDGPRWSSLRTSICAEPIAVSYAAGVLACARKEQP